MKIIKFIARKLTKTRLTGHERFGDPSKSTHRQKTVTRDFESRTIAWLSLPLAGILAGCQPAATVKCPPSALKEIHSVLVVPIEAPPLEIFPDLLETEQPVYRHFRNMALPVTAEEKVYWHRGGVLVAGRSVPDDEFREGVYDANDPAAPSSRFWSPTSELASAATLYLQNASIDTTLLSRSQPLPITPEKRNAYVGHWRAAIEKWFAQNSASADYRQTSTKPADLVLEVGINRYRLIYGQASLQVLLKLVDPKSGQVIAKSEKETYLPDASPEALLYPEGEGLKSLIRKSGVKLVALGFQDMGMASLHEPAKGKTF